MGDLAFTAKKTGHDDLAAEGISRTEEHLAAESWRDAQARQDNCPYACNLPDWTAGSIGIDETTSMPANSLTADAGLLDVVPAHARSME